MSAVPDAPWKVLASSVTGTSHLKAEVPCQDYCLFESIQQNENDCVVMVCADGAGSASRADLGAKLACQSALRKAVEWLEEGHSVLKITSDTVLGWYDRARRKLALEASLLGIDLREFACTLLLAIADRRSAAFAQVGDGAIVYREGDGFQPAFWPQSGEYANTTNFLTAPDFREHVAFRSLAEAPAELAMFTDGLQPLALHYASRSVHTPFFEPMFAALRKEADPARLEPPLKQFLTSKPVTSRTDDDATLILASRIHDQP